MAYNAWKNREKIDYYLDRSRNARFSFWQYAVAMRDTQMLFFDKYKSNEQAIRENLYTLLSPVTIVPTVVTAASTYTINHINYPSDFRYFFSCFNYVDGALATTTSTNYNMFNNVLLDSFRAPTNSKMYQLEDATGILLSRGVGGTLTSSLTYLIAPSEWSIGSELNLISAGTGVLTLGTNYTATSEVVQNSIIYQAGDQFVCAGTTTLTSGQVLPTSVLVNSNFPESVQDELCRLCAEYMSATTKDFPQSQVAGKAFEEASIKQ